jgi:hypothetical protein
MPDYRKPPVEKGGRPEAPPSAESLDFNIEATTMRLKSLRLRRREQELLEEHRHQSERKSDEVKRAVVEAVRPSGRVRHDERGMAVWDLAIATGEFQSLSATSALKKLDVDELKIEETTRAPALSIETGRDKGGGFDPYNQGQAARDRQAAADKLLGKKK